MKTAKVRRKTSVEQRRSRHGYLFCLPLIFGIVVMFIPHMVQTVVFTLHNVELNNSGYDLLWIGLDNYKRAFTQDPQFLVYLKDSLVSLFSTLPVIVIFSLFMAAILNQKFKGRSFFRTVFFIPVLLAAGVVAVVENAEASDILGMVSNSAIDTGTTVDWSSMETIKKVLTDLNFNDTLINIVAGAADSIYTIVQASGIQIMILLAGLQEIPNSLYEAAKVEGCDGWSIFWKITFPIVSPQLVVCAVYTVVDAYTSVNNTVATYAQTMSRQPSGFGYAAVLNFIYFAIVGIVLGLAGLVVKKMVHYQD